MKYEVLYKWLVIDVQMRKRSKCKECKNNIKVYNTDGSFMFDKAGMGWGMKIIDF